ncbi:acid phosphatase/Vanadium-dependent haloperoxidase [Microthyrium microscopicum]|uniref:Acid phosphatase/Vanadium-dependent haloperoxidase n=1 Tax=Microthyrium microscopicum TaxID=703497 RepID=A0A6A6UGC7_9PEZI|nr:acid phosphatase/Vanadium-dependent haloperoxidase [Microthyrium microscopicum]
MASRRLILSYVIDWIVIIIIAAIGAGFNFTGSYHRPFSLVDLSISYPYVPEQISTWLLVLITLILPAIIIFVVCLLLFPARSRDAAVSSKLIWRRKLWELNTGWMGLALSLALQFMLVQGMKNLFGKPRPDLLSRCQPDIANYKNHILSGTAFGTEFNPAWVLVGDTICQQTDKSLLNDGFRSFPSGHASFSWGGLFYLALFLASKFSIAIPYAPGRLASDDPDDLILPQSEQESEQMWSLSTLSQRNRAAAPPLPALALPLVPICVAIYITSTRYFQFYHHGFDLLFSSLLGTAGAWLAFRWYHPAISGGAGWSWGPRTINRAFMIAVGRGGYVGREGWSSRGPKEPASR